MKKFIIAVAVIVGLIAVGTSTSGDSDTEKIDKDIKSLSTKAEPTKTEPTEEAEPEPEVIDTAEEALEALNPQQQAVLEKVASYLDMGGFSKEGLSDQLEYEEFSPDLIGFAFRFIGKWYGGVDWNAQAVMKAESYVEMGGFSKPRLIDQLEYEGFTPAQAAHGATAALG